MTIAAERLAPRGLRLSVAPQTEVLARAKALWTLGPEFELAPESREPGTDARLALALLRDFCRIKALAPGAVFDLFPESTGGAMLLPAQETPVRLRLGALLAVEAGAVLDAFSSRLLRGFVTCKQAAAAIGAWGEPCCVAAEGTGIYAASTILAYEATLTPRLARRRYAGTEVGIAFAGQGRLWLDSRRGAALRAVLADTLPAMSAQEED